MTRRGPCLHGAAWLTEPLSVNACTMSDLKTYIVEDSQVIRERLIATLLELPGVRDVDRSVGYTALYITRDVGDAAEEAIKTAVAPFLREPPWR